MSSIKERDEIALSQNTIALKGFALAIQLAMVAAVPALTEVVQDSCSSSDSDSEDIDGSGRDIFTKKRTLNPAHARNLDKRTDVIFHSILVQDPVRPIDEAILVRHDEVHDSRVDNLVEGIRRNYQFNNSYFRGGLRKIDVVHLREKVKSSAKCKRAKKVITTSSEAENSVIVDLVLDKIKPQIDVMDSNIKIGSSRVDAIEGSVRKQVEALLGKFKGELISSHKDIVSDVCKDHLAAHKGPGNNQPSSPTNVIVPRCHTSHVTDANAKTTENVLRDISQYSTPPRSNRICESDNPTPTKKDHVESGYVCGTPVIQSGAQSANSENRSMQQSFQHKLTRQKNQDNIADEPSFSLGLTQEEQIQEDNPILGKTGPDHEQLSHTNVADNIEGSSSSRREAKDDSISVINVAGLAVSRREILLICERVLRSVLLHQLPSEGSQSAEFLDTKFGAAIMKNFPKFLKSKNKESYIFPKSLSGIFPTKEAPKVNPRNYYFPLYVGNKHWVGICFDAGCGTVTILDSCLALHKEKALEKIITHVIQMLPYLARYACLKIETDPVIQCYDVARLKSVAQFKNEADSGLISLLFMASHALYGPEACKNIGDDVLVEESKSATILAYEFKEKL
ncbi:uncharacterized protein LOC106425634 [Brassica napus]|uniref:uncharacterized protein LOC106425634 n=1 Tax=Brassica napus TaxID=3708 RepID=UPI00207969A2|nr:uncharacterized protein LOC106425634 [Brassica napus]